MDGSGSVKIAKINAWQAIIVALIGAGAGVGGTAGLSYYENASALADKDEVIAEREARIAELEGEVASRDTELRKSPMTLLRLQEIDLPRAECLDRLSRFHRAEVDERGGSAFRMHETSYDGHYLSEFDGFTLRGACPSDGGRAVVAVSLHPTNGGIQEVVELSESALGVLR